MEASEATAKFLLTLQEVKAKQMTVMDLQKKITEGEARLKQQQVRRVAKSSLLCFFFLSFFWYICLPISLVQNLYEAVRSDRNLYSKHLIEAQDEIAEMRRKFTIMNHQIQQLKEEIQSKDRGSWRFFPLCSVSRVHFFLLVFPPQS